MPRQQPPPRSKPSVCARALRLLARREHSAAELQHKLALRGIAAAEAAAAVETLAQAGWQSDARYVEARVRSRIAQGYGPLRIRSELESAGVEDTLARQALADAGADWKAMAAAAQARHFGELPKNPADWQKQYRYLAGRGFETAQIYAVLKGQPEE